ncbi:MAG TPA: TIGR03435 family protein [Bryobacteraceae bacterium]|nr:TIGR03435 family protein [Bryobacteraceae bacterium]
MLFRAGLAFSTAALVFAQPPRAFEVASVKPSHRRTVSADGQKGLGSPPTPTFEVDHLTFRARSLNLFALIIEAYGLKYCRPLGDACPMLSGGPAWLTKDGFDIDARMPSGSVEYDTIQLRNGNAQQLQEMLRRLLADRFMLKAHPEKRQLPVYAFTVADGGIRMKPAIGGSTPSVIFKPITPRGGSMATQLISVNSTVQEIADLYAKFMDRPVVDMTGLTGRFDFTVQFDVDPDASGPFGAVTSNTLFGAFEKQAGLKLRATRGPVNVLIINSVARPAAN